jgi:site-specific DNA-methyltransferase (adenine-specific)
MELMKQYPDKHFELAVVDPPYGLNVATGRSFGDPFRKDGTIRHGIDKRNGAKIIRKAPAYTKKDWDKETPSKEYFDELFRVSKNQIIWGANNFIDNLTNKTGWIFWDKVITGDVSFSAGELAWTSFDSNAKIAKHVRNTHEKRVHICQKPISVYRWLLENYAKPGQLILDTHVGSASSLIACESMGFDYVGFEIDPDYYAAAKNRMSKGIQAVLI